MADRSESRWNRLLPPRFRRLRVNHPDLADVALLVVASCLVWPLIDWCLRTGSGPILFGFSSDVVDAPSSVVLPFEFYDWEVYERAIERWHAGDPLYTRDEPLGYHRDYLYPPLVLLLLFPFVVPFDTTTGAMVWAGTSVLLLWVGLQLLIDELGYDLRRWERIVLLVALVGYQPLLLTIKMGQLSAFLVGLLCLAFVAAEREWGFDGGSRQEARAGDRIRSDDRTRTDHRTRGDGRTRRAAGRREPPGTPDREPADHVIGHGKRPGHRPSRGERSWVGSASEERSGVGSASEERSGVGSASEERSGVGSALGAYTGGALTGIVGFVKLSYAPVGTHLLVDRRRLVGAVGTVLFLIAASVASFGVETHLQYLDVLEWGIRFGNDARSPEIARPTHFMPLNWLPGSLAIRIGASLLVAATAVQSIDRSREAFALGLAAFPLLTPTGYSYYLVAVVPAGIVMLAVELERAGRPIVPVLAIGLANAQVHGVRFLTGWLPNHLTVLQLADPIYPLFQPGLWGCLALVVLAYVRLDAGVASRPGSAWLRSLVDR